jgi:hypothetical protein
VNKKIDKKKGPACRVHARPHQTHCAKQTIKEVSLRNLLRNRDLVDYGEMRKLAAAGSAMIVPSRPAAVWIALVGTATVWDAGSVGKPLCAQVVSGEQAGAAEERAMAPRVPVVNSFIGNRDTGLFFDRCLFFDWAKTLTEPLRN